MLDGVVLIIVAFARPERSGRGRGLAAGRPPVRVVEVGTTVVGRWCGQWVPVRLGGGRRGGGKRRGGGTLAAVRRGLLRQLERHELPFKLASAAADEFSGRLERHAGRALNRRTRANTPTAAAIAEAFLRGGQRGHRRECVGRSCPSHGGHHRHIGQHNRVGGASGRTFPAIVRTAVLREGVIAGGHALQFRLSQLHKAHHAEPHAATLRRVGAVAHGLATAEGAAWRVRRVPRWR
mmetsp:Transcript_15939/g.49423  ORF Transcript_15939/g.49423 Transcript_15939/m.49423 type:complete len:236 (+) Transcript_15939:656-1363(+)